MKRDYKKTWQEIRENPENYFSDNPDNLDGVLFNDLIEDKPSDNVFSYFEFVFNDAKMINKYGYIDYCKTIDDDGIIALCEKFAVYEFWAKCFDHYDWFRAIKICDDRLKLDIGEIIDIVPEIAGKARAMDRVFCYYHNKVKPRHDIKKMAADTLNDERAAGGLQAANPQPTPTPAALNLPDKLATKDAIKYFSRAVEKGYMTITENGATWNKSQVECGFVCWFIYKSNIPRTQLSKYFGLINLSASIAQAEYDYILYKDKNATLKDSVIQWIERTNKDVFFD